MSELYSDKFRLEDYLRRVGFEGDVKADLFTLKALIRHQGRSIPFENLDVLAGKTISLEPDHLVDKIVHGGRGGYCYEANAILAMGLAEVGFSVTLVAARPRIFPVLRPRTHMAVVVEVDGQNWLCDAAFGSAMPPEPLCLDELDSEIELVYDRFKMTLDDACGEYYLHTWMDGEWQTQYSFNLSPYEWVDFAPGNYLNSAHPDSFFRKQPAMVLFTEHGRNLLFGDRLKVMVHGVTEVRVIAPDERDGVFREYFGITGEY